MNIYPGRFHKVMQLAALGGGAGWATGPVTNSGDHAVRLARIWTERRLVALTNQRKGKSWATPDQIG